MLLTEDTGRLMPMGFHLSVEHGPAAAPVTTDSTGKLLVEGKRTTANNAVSAPPNGSNQVSGHELSSILFRI
jgi:hypothetical protein